MADSRRRNAARAVSYCRERRPSTMEENWPDGLRDRLEKKKSELTARLERITANLRRGLETDSKERAKQLDDSQVVDALGNEAREELDKISLALRRMDAGKYGLCTSCGAAINNKRIEAYPYASECIDCATMEEEIRART
jgi:RNA polymerase-binding protein DksA